MTICVAIFAAYFLVGFIFGVIREKAHYEMGMQSLVWDVIGKFCFPVTSLDDEGECRELLDETEGGVLYWTIIGLIWPITIIWSILAWLCFLVFVVLATIGIPIERLVKKVVGIP